MQRAPSGKFVVRWREGGRQRSRSFGSEQDARQFDAEIKRRKQTGGLVLSRSDVPTLGKEAASWLASRTDLAPSTEALYTDVIARQILPELGGYNLLDLRPRLLAEWQSAIAGSSGTRAAQIAYNVLSQILDRAVAHEYLPDNKLRSVKRARHDKRPVVAATVDQVEVVRAHFHGEPHRQLLISLIAYVGLRPPQEPLGLMWSDFEDRQLHIRRRNVYGSIRPWAKGGTQRIVIVPSPVRAEIQAYRLRIGNPTGLILPGREGQPITRTAWQSFTQKGFARARKAAKLPDDFTPYSLRHTCASLMLASGVPLPLVARQLGNSIAVCASTYAHLVNGPQVGAAPPLDDQIRDARVCANRASDDARSG